MWRGKSWVYLCPRGFVRIHLSRHVEQRTYTVPKRFAALSFFVSIDISHETPRVLYPRSLHHARADMRARVDMRED